MSGTRAGTGQPLYLKCSKCKSTLNRGDRLGELVRTGRTRKRRSRAVPIRIHPTHEFELRCLRCGHVGWYGHKDAARKPLMSAPLKVHYRQRLHEHMVSFLMELSGDGTRHPYPVEDIAEAMTQAAEIAYTHPFKRGSNT